jgi:hypothetical protein
MWATANRRNRRMGSKRVIGVSALRELAVRSAGRCAVTGISFRWDGEKPERGAFAISLDRIMPGMPYTARNCRLVLRAVNYAMNAWGQDVFWQVAENAVGQRLISSNRCSQISAQKNQVPRETA